MIDTHCHLDYSEFSEAAIHNLKALITVGTDPSNWGYAVNFTTDHRIFAALGVHPNAAAHARDRHARATLETLLSEERVVGVGETGFDTHWDRQTIADQQFAYEWQADLAHAHNVPLIMHIRSRPGQDAAANASVIARRALERYPGTLVVLHCFNGDEGLLELAIERDFYVSFAGNLTFKNARELHAAAPRVRRERLLVETDAPYLAPVPKRGKRNQPTWVHHTAAFLAELLGEDAGALERTLDENAIRAFSLPSELGGS